MSLWEVKSKDGKESKFLVSTLLTEYAGSNIDEIVKRDYDKSQGEGSFDNYAGNDRGNLKCLSSLPIEAAERAEGVYNSKEDLKKRLAEIKEVFENRVKKMADVISSI